MKPGARLQAAVEVLTDILERHRPAADALSDWGKGHRFAGSGDRAAIGNVVYDALRRRQSLAARMGSDTPRALVIATAGRTFALSADMVAAAADGTPHTLPPLSDDERAALDAPDPATDMRIRSPFLRCLVMRWTRSASIRLACFFGMLWASARSVPR